MNEIGLVSLYGLFFGMIGTTLGGIIGATLKVNSDKLICFILELAAGLMTSVICFDLVPEAFNIVRIPFIMIGISLGVFTMVICEKLVNEITNKNHKLKENSLLKTSIIIAIGLAIHNFPEGLSIGAGFEASPKLGVTLALAIAFHDIPEGISIALPLKKSGVSVLKAILITAFSGLTTGIGAFFGAMIGNISKELIGISLAFAAGAMLYIVSCELIPESKRRYQGKFASIGNIVGIILGMIVLNR